MKKLVLFMVFVIIMAGLSVSCTKKEEKSVKVLSINDIKSDPLSFTGKITISGTAAAFAQQDSTIFGVVDTAELITCKNLNCGAFMLPVKYTGSSRMPELADVVEITGSFVSYQGGHIFEVTSLTVMRNIRNILIN